MKISAAPRLIGLLGLLSLASCPAAAQSRAHAYAAGPGRPPPRAAFGGDYGRPRPGFQPPRQGYPAGPPGYPAGPYGLPPAPARSEFAGRPYPPPPYPGPPGGYGPGYGGGFGGNWRAEQDEVRRAVRDGRHVPLSQAIAAVRQRSPGHVLDAGMEGGPDGRTLYRLRWATNDGRRVDYLVDAATGVVIGVQGGR